MLQGITKRKGNATYRLYMRILYVYTSCILVPPGPYIGGLVVKISGRLSTGATQQGDVRSFEGVSRQGFLLLFSETVDSENAVRLPRVQRGFHGPRRLAMDARYSIKDT